MGGKFGESEKLQSVKSRRAISPFYVLLRWNITTAKNQIALFWNNSLLLDDKFGMVARIRTHAFGN